MKIGDLIRFCPEVWGTPLEDRPLGVVMNVEAYYDGIDNEYPMITAIFPGDDIPYSSNIKDFEVVNEDW